MTVDYDSRSFSRFLLSHASSWACQHCASTAPGSLNLSRDALS